MQLLPALWKSYSKNQRNTSKKAMQVYVRKNKRKRESMICSWKLLTHLQFILSPEIKPVNLPKPMWVWVSKGNISSMAWDQVLRNQVLVSVRSNCLYEALQRSGVLSWLKKETSYTVVEHTTTLHMLFHMWWGNPNFWIKDWFLTLNDY